MARSNSFLLYDTIGNIACPLTCAYPQNLCIPHWVLLSPHDSPLVCWLQQILEWQSSTIVQSPSLCFSLKHKLRCTNNSQNFHYTDLYWNSNASRSWINLNVHQNYIKWSYIMLPLPITNKQGWQLLLSENIAQLFKALEPILRCAESRWF